MKEKNPDTAAFADYAQQYHTYKNKMAELQKEVDYIKSLFEVSKQVRSVKKTCMALVNYVRVATVEIFEKSGNSGKGLNLRETSGF